MPKKSSSKAPNTPAAIASWDMPKKSSSKKVSSKQSSATAKEKSSKTFGQEIEEIFSKKRKKPEHEKTRKVAEGVVDKLDGKDSSLKEKARKKRSRSGNVDAFEKEQAAPRPKRKTADGLVIYSEEDLGIGKADAGDLICAATNLGGYGIKFVRSLLFSVKWII